MARTAPLVGHLAASDPLVDLDRLLGRLQQNILRADAERVKRLRSSQEERIKATYNINHARNLLTRLEQDALGVKALSRRQEFQGDLVRKREIIERLLERVHELGDKHPDHDDVEDEDDAEVDSDVEDLLGGLGAPETQSPDTTSAEMTPSDDTTSSEQKLVEQLSSQHTTTKSLDPPMQPVPEAPSVAGPNQTLRARGKQPTSASTQTTLPTVEDTAHTTATSPATTATTNTTTRTKLFGNRTTDNPMAAITTTETILDHQRAEQDALTESMARMATDLKFSSLLFAEALEEDTELLNRAGEGLDKNERGMEMAARRMGALAKMSEGTGWWGRIMLYVWIYAMMVGLLVLVFVLPKLRF